MHFIIPLVVVVLICVFLIGRYNEMVTRKNRVDNSFSQIDVQLKRRADLIPNLVETVKGYAKHESQTFERISNARSMYNSASSDTEKIESDKEMTVAIKNVLALSENYPELKANTNFMSLQGELTKIEEKISFSRQFYNDTVMLYNNCISMFPNNILASTFGFKERIYFIVDEIDKAVPKVSFD